MSPVKSYTFSISENSTGCLSIRINGSNYINDYVDISPREIKQLELKTVLFQQRIIQTDFNIATKQLSPIFGDIGEGITDENGECIVEIGDIFTETVTTRIEYQVFCRKKGKEICGLKRRKRITSLCTELRI